MALKQHKCRQCGFELLAFENEPDRLKCARCNAGQGWEALSPIPTVVHASSRLMVEYYLDSIWTIHESASKMIRESADAREYKQYQKALTS